jgi:hypothetical protein
MKVEFALKPLLDLMSIILWFDRAHQPFEAFSTENSKGKVGRLIRTLDIKILQTQ